MTHASQELADEFPEHAARIHALKASDSHIARLAEQYHNVNGESHRLQSRVETGSEKREEESRKQRLRLKNERAAIMAKAQGPPAPFRGRAATKSARSGCRPGGVGFQPRETCA